MPGVQPPSQQATRHARRVYVGGLPPTGNEQNIATFFSNALAAIGGTTAGPGAPFPTCMICCCLHAKALANLQTSQTSRMKGNFYLHKIYPFAMQVPAW